MVPSSAFTARPRSRTLLGMAVPRPVYRPALSWSQTPTQLSAAAGPTLSNGDALDLHTTVDDTDTDFQPVRHTLPIVVGTSVTSEVPTSVLGPHDTFPFHAAKPPRTPSADTKVDTLMPQIPVVTATDPVSANGTVVSPASAFGQSAQMLWMKVSG
jgi:hypothetical protein